MVRCRQALGPCIAMALALQGCAQAEPPPVAEAPEGAVPAGDVAGCPAYVAWRRDGAVRQAIRFRSRHGGFTLYREEALCAQKTPDAKLQKGDEE